jgi:hypothetical protein
VVVSTLEWILVGLILLGIVPAWLLGLAAFISSRKPEPNRPGARNAAYVKLLETLYPKSGEGDFSIENGAVWAACLRELKNYPEYADLSLLLLEEINLTGTRKFESVMKVELTSVESYLLGLRDD